MNKKIRKPSTTIAARFWPKVDKRGPEECWEWRGGRVPDGYGLLYVGGPVVMMSGHRIAWMLSGRDLPVKPFVLDHVCKNRRCVNVAHLRVVTQHDNVTVHSDAPAGRMFRRTHCGNGHEFTPESTRYYVIHGLRGVRRLCLACNRQDHPRARLKPISREAALAELMRLRAERDAKKFIVPLGEGVPSW